jgi:hypothetical protein
MPGWPLDLGHATVEEVAIVSRFIEDVADWLPAMGARISDQTRTGPGQA